jgi:hypothetical protein
LEVDLGELKDKEEVLSGFLRSSLKVDVASRGDKLSIDSEKLSLQELSRVVNKFIYHQNLNNKYWVTLEGSAVKINKFKGAEKRPERKKKTTPPSTITHGW